MYRGDAAIRGDIHQGAIEAVPAPIGGPFDAAQDNRNFMVAGQAADGVETAGINLHGLGRVVGVHLFLHRGIKPGSVSKFNPERIPRDQRLAKRNQAAVFHRGVLDIRFDLFKRFFAIQPDRGDLGQSYFQGIGHAHKIPLF